MSSLHDAFSSLVGVPLLTTIGRARQGTLSEARLFREGLETRRLEFSWGDDQKAEATLQRLRAAVRYAYTSTAFYRRRLDEAGLDVFGEFDFDAFSRVPSLERHEVQSHSDSLRSSFVERSALSKMSTGGSTGAPVEVLLGPLERAWRSSGVHFSNERLGVVHGVRRAMLWGHHLDVPAKVSARERVLNFLNNHRWYDCLHLSESKLLAYDADLRRYRPGCLLAYASSLAALASAIQGMRLDATNYPTRCIITGAEKLYEPQRALIESVFGAPVHERYGGRDVGDIGFQYRPRSDRRFVVDHSLVLVQAAEPGHESELLVTKLAADGMPMLRYRTGDLARWGREARRGEVFFNVEEVIGRRVSRIHLPDGTWLNGLHFPHLLKDYPVAEFQVRQSSDYSVDVQLVVREGAALEWIHSVEALLARCLTGVRVSVRVVSSIRRTAANKWQPVVSELAGMR
jgi:phenylacetate-CoA ligase